MMALAFQLACSVLPLIAGIFLPLFSTGLLTAAYQFGLGIRVRTRLVCCRFCGQSFVTVGRALGSLSLAGSRLCISVHFFRQALSA
jgi:hypothetical protein